MDGWMYSKIVCEDGFGLVFPLLSSSSSSVCTYKRIWTHWMLNTLQVLYSIFTTTLLPAQFSSTSESGGI